MRYHVRGISRATGRETTLVINAKHHEAAEAVARRELIVSGIVPEGGLAEPEPFEPESDVPNPDTPVPPSDTLQELVSSVGRAEATPQRRHPIRRSTAPYVFLVFLVILLAILAVHIFIRG